MFFLGVDLMAAEDIDGLHPESVRMYLSRGSFDVSPADEVWSYYLLVTGCPSLPSLLGPSVSPSVCPYQCVCRWRGWERRGRENISIQSSLQILSSTKSNSTMTAAWLSCTVSKVSAECLTQAVGFLMGLFPKDLLDSACFRRYIYSLTSPIHRIIVGNGKNAAWEASCNLFPLSYLVFAFLKISTSTFFWLFHQVPCKDMICIFQLFN